MPRTSTWMVLCVLLLPLSGCVRKSTHEVALADLAEARAEGEDLRDEVARREAREAALETELREMEARETELRRRIAEVEREVRTLEALRAEAVDGLNTTRSEVDRLQLLLSRRGSEYEALREQLSTLRAIEEEIRDRNRIYENMIGRFQSLIDGGRVSVDIVRGRMVIQLPQDILFASGSATIGAEGRRTLQEIGSVLGELDDREFQVEGHTDNVPISTERFPSNWELSSARALSVVRLLIQSGVAPERVSGAGFGEFQPVAPNDDAASRRLNRRIEIVMLPNLDVIAGTSLPNG
ncbi:MAG: OmpA family protein [Gemmatimonadota bacterium]